MKRSGTVLGLWACCIATACGAAPSNRGALVAAQVTIDRNGARSDQVSGDESAAFCARFRLSEAEVGDYFHHADRVDSTAFNHDLDMSRCYASGTIRFRDDRHGQWFIDFERRGLLTLSTGERLYLYCLSCTSPRFDELDDETADNARALIRAAAKK